MKDSLSKMAKIIKIPLSGKLPSYNPLIFSDLEYSYKSFPSHQEIAAELINQNPYTITVIIDNLDPVLWRKKAYSKQSRTPIESKYNELLYQYFFAEYGDIEGNKLYAQFLEKYRPLWKKDDMKRELDDYIIELELIPRYHIKIIKKFKNINQLKKSRFRIKLERYYHLPYPLNHVDWRNPYDNIFVWREAKKKFITRGGSGSSGQRERNSQFIYGFSLMNQKLPIPSYLFLYNKHNKLYFIKQFPSLTVPQYDIGANYFLSSKEEANILRGIKFITWNSFNEVKEIKIPSYGGTF